MIPRDLIYNVKMETYEIKNKTKVNNKRVMLYSYFASKRSLDDTVGFSCDEVVKWCGYKPNYNKDKINDEITQLVKSLTESNYMSVSNDYKIYRNTYSMAKLNIEKFDNIPQFALVYLDEIDKIRNFDKYTDNKNKISPPILLLVLTYIRVNLLRRQDKYVGKESDKPEFCYRMYKDIETDIGLSSRYISRTIKILDELNLIVSKELPRYKDNDGNWHTSVTLFVNRYKRETGGESLDMNYDYKQELQWGEEYIREKKYLSKGFNQNTENK